MLRFVLGRSGSGKTTLIQNKICDLVLNGCDKVMLIVPDQSSFETEKEFLDLLGAKNSKKVLVFGFSRLCRYVFEQTNTTTKNVIDNGTRAVFMSLALEQLTEKLDLLGTAHKKSVVDVMLQTITDLKKSSINSDTLRLGAETVTDKTLREKLIETALVADTFDALVAQSYIDPLDDLDRLYNILSENNIFDGYTVFYDGFSGFTAAQLKVIRLLMQSAADTYAALTLDPQSSGDEEVFATSHATYNTLKDIAKRDGIPIKSPIKADKILRFKSDDLKILEQGIFRGRYDSVSSVPSNIMLYSASDIYAECEFVARQIKKLVIDKGYLYSDISIICHETAPYDGILNEVLQKYDIPYFMDVKSNIDVKPVIRLVNSIFRAVLGDFERDDIIAILKTGLTGATADEINIFENYIFVWNVNRTVFKSEFKQNPRGFADKFTSADEADLQTAEKIRKLIITPLIEFKNNAKDKNGREITELLYNLIISLGAPDALRAMYSRFQLANEPQIGAEQIKIYNMFVEILDKMAAVLDSQSVTLGRYFELLSLQISAMQLSQIPQTIDSVTVTTAQRVRVSKQRASFLIGCIDGVFPAVPHTSGIFSSFELKLLSLSDITLCESFSDFANLETFMAYCCMTSPSEKLYISYPMADLQGNSHTPSVIFAQAEKVFSNIRVYDAIDFDGKKDSMLALQPAFDEFARSLCHSDHGMTGLHTYFSDNAEYISKLSAIKRARDRSPFEIQNPENAEKLFGENLNISASQIEKFSMCRFSYFCNYGLRIREHRKAEINPMEYGTLVHYILEKFFTQFSKAEYSLMTQEQINSFTEDVLNQYISSYFGGEESKSKSFMYKLSVLKSNVCELLCHIVSEMSQSDFDAVDCELKIGSDIPAYTLNLPDGHNIAICGSVDRVDVMEKDGVKYLRVIDYKTGTKKFKLSDILYGINLQMLLYLYTIQSCGSERYGKVIPSGILYMPATVPTVTGDKDYDLDKITAEIDKALKMNGLLLNDTTVIHGMDKTDNSKYIPVKIKLDEPVSARSLATLEDFGKIFKKIDCLVAEMGRNLYSGKIQAEPVIGANDACKYCPYDSVCAYRKGEGKNTFDVDNEEVMHQISNELSREERGEE